MFAAIKLHNNIVWFGEYPMSGQHEKTCLVCKIIPDILIYYINIWDTLIDYCINADMASVLRTILQTYLINVPDLLWMFYSNLEKWWDVLTLLERGSLSSEL